MIARKPRSQTEKRIDAINAGADLLGQVKFTAGKAFYGGEEYILQRGNNRRIIAVSKGAKCSIIDTPFDATEATAEVAAATAILKGLDGKATAEATFNVAQGESIWLFFKLDSTENATVDWGDGTTESITNYSVYHTYNVSGVVTQKITAPKATKATIAGESRENVLYIGGEITQVTNAHGRTKMVIWGDKVQQFSKGGWGSQIKYKCDIAFPPGATSLYGTWGNNVNYCYIPAICTTISSMQSDTFEQIEIEPSGGELTLSGYYLFGHSGNYAGRTMNSISLPARAKIADKSYLELASGRALKYMRFESGHTTVPSSFMYTANKNYTTNTYSKMYVYIPKTVISIGNSAFASPVHFVYEGTYTEWNAIEKSDGFVTNGGTYELSCKNAPNDGGMRYENFENDIKNAGSKSEINAGDGIEISSSNTIGVALADDDAGLMFSGGKLKAAKATNTKFGIVKGGTGIDISSGTVNLGKTIINLQSKLTGYGTGYVHWVENINPATKNSIPGALMLWSTLYPVFEIHQSGESRLITVPGNASIDVMSKNSGDQSSNIYTEDIQYDYDENGLIKSTSYKITLKKDLPNFVAMLQISYQTLYI